LQAVGRGRGIQRTVETPLKVWILTDVPIPIPVDQLIDSRTIGDAGPLDVLAARGIIPLDYIGIAAALSDWFESASKVKNWLEHRLEIRSKLKRLGLLARDGDGDVCELCGISHKESNMGDSAQLAAYSYRRSGARQSNVVLVNVAAHADARAAVEAVLGPLETLQTSVKETTFEAMEIVGRCVDVGDPLAIWAAVSADCWATGAPSNRDFAVGPI
jgi:hypothetical protein